MRSTVLVVVWLGVCGVMGQEVIQRTEEEVGKKDLKAETLEENHTMFHDQQIQDIKTLEENATEDISTEMYVFEFNNTKLNVLSERSKPDLSTRLKGNQTNKLSRNPKIEGKFNIENNNRDTHKFKEANDLVDGKSLFTEDYVENTTPIDSEAHDTTKFERRSDDKDVTYVDQESPRTRKEQSMPRGGYKTRRLITIRHSPKMVQRRTFDIWSLLGMGDSMEEEIVKVTKEVPIFFPYAVENKIPVPVTLRVERKIPVEVPKPYPVPVEKKVYYPVKEYVQAPYPVYKKVPYFVKIMVEKPIPVHISKPYPVYIEKKVPYAVEKEVPYPVKIPVDRPVPVHIPVLKNIYYPVEKKVHYPVAVTVEKPVPVPVEKPYPVYIEKNVPVPVETHVAYPAPVEEHKQDDFGSNDFAGDDYSKEEFVPLQKDQTFNLEEHNIGNQFVKDNSFMPLSTTGALHDHSQLQKKKDVGGEQDIQETKKEENVETPKSTSTTEQTSTTPFTPEKKDQKGGGEEKPIAEKIDIQDFGKRIKKT